MDDLIKLFKKDFTRIIETVIKADDQEHIQQEIEEFVITTDISKKIADFFDSYNEPEQNKNGVWISGFFGSGKSHLLKILSYVLENKEYHGTKLGELFASKINNEPKLKADIQKAIKQYRSESILFNIDQQAQITAKTDANAILQVFYKVFYDHQGFYGFQPHVADFEHYLTKEEKFDLFQNVFGKYFSRPWKDARKDYVDPLISDAIAQACGEIYNQPATKYTDYLDIWEKKQRYSIEDFANRVNDYILSKGKGFRLNFFVDEVGQFIAENTKLMLNLQTIAESLGTKCKGNSWIIVTSQEDLESLVGNDSIVQSDDFSKIQGRFSVRLPLTSSNVDEVIEKRLLEKNVDGETLLNSTYYNEKENIKTLLSFSETGMQFKGFEGNNDFVNKYPFLPYQFDLFQQCIKALSKHNVFQGKHQSVGERSMLGVFQEILKKSLGKDNNYLVSFDSMFEGIRATLRAESQNAIFLAESQLQNSLEVRILKILFLIKYFDSFKATGRNISILLIDSLKINPVKHLENVEKALNLLEYQTYIQRNGEFYEYLTDDEKNVEDEIKNTDIDLGLVSHYINELVFDGIVKESRIKFNKNKQEFEFTRKVDGQILGREKELKIEIITTNSDHYNHEVFFNSSTLSDQGLMIVKLPEDIRLISDVRMSLKTDKYVKQRQSSNNKENITRILFEKGKLNRERKTLIQNQLNILLSKSTFFLNGVVHKGSNSSDGKTRIIENAQDLIELAFSKLILIGSNTYDENQLRLTMLEPLSDIFSQDNNNISAPEREILHFLERRKNQHDKTNLSDLSLNFSKKPYGWTPFAIWCITAKLFRRGKIEAKQNTNMLNDVQFLEAMTNNRNYLTTIVSPQIEIDRNKINLLKQIHLDTFNESNPYTEVKDVVSHFKNKASALLNEIQNLLTQQKSYHFLKSLEPLQQLLSKLIVLDYTSLVTNSSSFENELIDDKESFLDPIKKFMSGEQKKIYDRMLNFLYGNQANFDYIDKDDERQILLEAMNSPMPYNGNIMQEVKKAMDTLQQRIIERLEQERNETIESSIVKIKQLSEQEHFEKLNPSQQEELLKPLREVEARSRNQNYIANLMQERQNLSNLFTNQLNHLSKIISKSISGVTEPKELFIHLRSVEMKIRFEKSQLKSESDVDDYLKHLKKEMMEQINANRNITLN